MKSAMTANNKAVVSSKGQIVIPKALREKLGIHTGHELHFKARLDGVIEIKPVKRSINMFFSRCKRVDEKSISIEEMDEAIAQAVTKKAFRAKRKER